MNYQDYTSIFKKQLEDLTYSKQLDLALAVCNKLYPDYQEFVEVHEWGNSNLLMKAIKLCEQGKTGLVNISQLEEMLEEVETICPDMDDFGDYTGSYALNASAAVYETLAFLMDKDKEHIFAVATFFTDTVDFKIREENEDLSEAEIDRHPVMVEAWNFMIQLSQ
jgi:uncharacterized protein YjaG (DUF416 family)